MVGVKRGVVGVGVEQGWLLGIARAVKRRQSANDLIDYFMHMIMANKKTQCLKRSELYGGVKVKCENV